MDTAEFMKKLNNSVMYSEGFLQGIELERLEFNRVLGGYTVAALEKYIDARARMNPDALHHVYEFDAVGSSNARLFKFTVNATKNNIVINGEFLPSKSIQYNSKEPFVNKASIMENKITITIAPRGDNPLAFEDEGEMVFTRKTIVIDNPGGDEVAGSFAATIDDFFNNYFTNALLSPLLKELQTPTEFSRNFAAGSKRGKVVGVRAGRRYFTLIGGIE
jgi:hypothetical protein